MTSSSQAAPAAASAQRQCRRRRAGPQAACLHCLWACVLTSVEQLCATDVIGFSMIAKLKRWKERGRCHYARRGLNRAMGNMHYQPVRGERQSMTGQLDLKGQLGINCRQAASAACLTVPELADSAGHGHWQQC